MNQQQSLLRFKQFIWILALIAHLLLLYWIIFLLQEAKTMEVMLVAQHFFGISLAGALLIFILAKLTKWIHLKELLYKKLARSGGGHR